MSHVILDRLREEGVVGIRTDYEKASDRQTVRLEFARGVAPLDVVVDLGAVRGAADDVAEMSRQLLERAGTHRREQEAARERERRAAREEFAGRAPDLMEAVVGFRQWNLEGGRLMPIGAGADVWRGADEIRAECTSGLHDAPASGCHCGLNAWHDFSAEWLESGGVAGVVVGRGAVRVHVDGWRAEYARPVALAYGEGEWHSSDPVVQALATDGAQRSLVRNLATRLGVAAVDVRELEAYVSLLEAEPVPLRFRPGTAGFDPEGRG